MELCTKDNQRLFPKKLSACSVEQLEELLPISRTTGDVAVETVVD